MNSKSVIHNVEEDDPGMLVNIVRMTIVLLFTGLIVPGSALGSESRNVQGAFVIRGIDARAMAMGGAYSALADATTAFFWNPGGLGFFEEKEITGMYQRLFGLINSGYVAYGQGAPKKGGSSFAWLNTSGEIEGDPNTILESVGYSENSIYIAYGRKVNESLSIGGTGKLLFASSGFDEVSGKGVGFDVGAMVLPIPCARFGLILRDLFSQVSWQMGPSDRLPIEAQLGVAYTPVIPTNRMTFPRFTFSGDIYGGEETVLKKIALGAEGWVEEDIFALRSGFNRNFDGMGRNVYTFGSGIHLEAGKTIYFLDYAFLLDSDGDDLGNSHRISVGGRF
jgi:hypothetical protein